MTEIHYVSPEHSEIPPEEVLKLIRENLSSIRVVVCSETFNTQNVQELCRILIDHPAHTNVESLSLPRNELALEAAQAIARLLYENTTIGDLDLSYNGLGQEGTQALVQPLVSQNTTLFSLNLTHNDLGVRGAGSIAILVTHTNTLQELILGHNHLGPRGIRALAPRLSACRSLTTVCLSHNQLGHRGVHLLATELKENDSCLHVLDVSSNHASVKGTRALIAWLIYNTSLHTLLLNSNDVGPIGAAALSTLLQFNHTLLHLHLSGNDIGDEGASSLSRGLVQSQSLQTLMLDWNHISNQGAQSLGDALMHNASLQLLDLSGNQIACDGGVALARALPYNVDLLHLNVAHNQLRDEAALAFAEALVGGNHILETLKYDENPISDTGVLEIQHAFRYRRNYRLWFGSLLESVENLFTLNLFSKEIGDEEVIALARKLGHHENQLRAMYIGGKLITGKGVCVLCAEYLEKPSCLLQRLYVNDSRIGSEGLEALAGTLSKNRSLRVLSVTNCGITAAGAKALSTAFQHENDTRISLERMVLDGNNLGNEGLVELVNGLQHEACPLVSLSIADNGITDATSITRTHLREVNLRGNGITDGDALDLARSLLDGCPFERLSLVDNPLTERGGEALARFLPPTTDFEYK